MTVYLGLMSGTSMDGVDAALVDVTTHRFIGGITQPYDKYLQMQLQNIASNAAVTPAHLWQLHTILGKQFAAAANQLLTTLSYPREEVIAIGSHGQTILHDATAEIPYTIQLGCPHTISELTGMTVVADFRTRDIVLGGQGAPFAPLYHHVLFGEGNKTLAVVNIGGIANITVLSDDVYGYDLGPGNCLMDAWILSQENKPYDVEGRYAASGQIIPELLTAMLADDYFALPSPKSICKSYFSIDWLGKFLKPDYVPQDVQATLLALTVQSISNAIEANTAPIQRLMLCGGGAHNHALVQALDHTLPNVEVLSTKDQGIEPDFLEAMMFAWLAHQAMTETSLDLTHITGASKAAILGVIYKI